MRIIGYRNVDITVAAGQTSVPIELELDLLN